MDFDGEPSRFLDYDVDSSRRALSVARAVSFPCSSWHDLWSHHHSFDGDSSLLIGSCDDFSFGAEQSSEYKMQNAVSHTNERKLKQGKDGARLVRCETWSYMCAGTDVGLESERSLVQQQPTVARDDSRVTAFTAGEASAETQHAVTVSAIYSSTSSSESRQPSASEPNAQDRLLNLRDLLPAQSDHSVILSAIKSFDQLHSGRRGSKDDRWEEFCENQNDAQTCSWTEASQLESSVIQQQHQTADCYKRSKLFGLPGHINVSKREMNMMSPTSF